MAPTSPSSPPSTKAFYDSLGKRYEDIYGHDTGLLDAVARWLDQLPSDARVIDCGCGTGRPVAEMVMRSGRAVHGIDLSEKMVEICREQVPGGTFQAVSMLEYEPEEEEEKKKKKKEVEGVVASLSLFEVR